MPRPIPPPAPAPPLRLPEWPLPPYRYVPGLNPHPFRHPGGHMYTDGSAPEEPPWSPVHWREDRGWLRGMDLFDHRYYWESHEIWEAIWHAAPRGEPYRELLQGLIQGAAGVLKRHLDSGAAAERLLGRADARLAAVEAAAGPCFQGLDLPATRAALSAPWPRLVDAAR